MTIQSTLPILDDLYIYFTVLSVYMRFFFFYLFKIFNFFCLEKFNRASKSPEAFILSSAEKRWESGFYTFLKISYFVTNLFYNLAGPSTPRAEEIVTWFPPTFDILKRHDWSKNQWNSGPPSTLLKKFFKIEDGEEYNS